MTRGYFVTGTDTGVGKTYVSLGLMERLQADGHVVVGMKPVASGCSMTADGLVNADALALQERASFSVPYAQVNPYAFELAVAPHLAAAAAGITISSETIRHALEELTQTADRVVVEGVGGWMVPINERQNLSDLAVELDLPVVLVVAIRLGCINHALLSAGAIERSGCRFAGWVANHMDSECEFASENVEALRQRITAPCLGELHHTDGAQAACDQFMHLSLG